MAKKPMLDTKFLFQPRGQKTAYLFRMATPLILVGRTNPRTGKPYGSEIRESLGGTRDLKIARQERDRRLGAIREEERQVIENANGSMDQALDVAASLRNMEDEERDTIESVLVDEAQELETKIRKRLEPKLGREKATEEAGRKASRWYKAAMGWETPVILRSCRCYRQKPDTGTEEHQRRDTLHEICATIPLQRTRRDN